MRAPHFNQDGDRSEAKVTEPDADKNQFRLRRRKDRKRQRKGLREKREKQKDIETSEVTQDADKERGGGFGLSSKKQITRADAVLAEASVNEVRFTS